MNEDPEPVAIAAQADTETEAAARAARKAERIRQTVERITTRIASTQLNDLQERVAWVLNRYPETRDSDKELALVYWANFEDADEASSLSALRHLTPITSLVRQRARIQNELELFQASPPVKANRGTLSEEERQAQRSTRRDTHPSVSIFMDETGKSDQWLIVGGLWAINPYNEITLGKEIGLWKDSKGLKEIHFSEMSRQEVPAYEDLLELLVPKFGTFGFKFIAVDRRAAGHGALDRLYYNLVALGVEHEHSSGRCRLPRTLSIWKDADEPTADALFMADLKDRLLAASSSRFGDLLVVDQSRAVPSTENHLVQVADVLLGAVNRHLNGNAVHGEHFKDLFARRCLHAFQINPNHPQQVADLACRLHL